MSVSFFGAGFVVEVESSVRRCCCTFSWRSVAARVILGAGASDFLRDGSAGVVSAGVDVVADSTTFRLSPNAGVGGRGVNGDIGKDAETLGRCPGFHVLVCVTGVSSCWCEKRAGKGGGGIFSDSDSARSA